MQCTLVGDLHGKVHLLQLDSPKPIIQIGDFGFREAYRLFMNTPQSELMIVGGNHDEYPILKTMPSYLGDFGIIPRTQSTFFVRGAWSIDRAWRVEGKSWWHDEELSLSKGNEMLDAYELAKPQVMVTHDCPNMVKHAMFQASLIPNYTGSLLDECLKIHIPKIWIFGHWHQDKTYNWGDTCKFICLDEGTHLTMDLP